MPSKNAAFIKCVKEKKEVVYSYQLLMHKRVTDKTQKSHTHNPSLTLYLASKKILKQFLFYDED